MKKTKKKKNGFTLIEIVITMAIFGFLLYIITAILIVIVQTVFTINQRSFLRTNLESAMKSISEDAQFADGLSLCTNPVQSSLANSCVSMNVPSSTTQASPTVKNEMIYYDPNLSTIVKSVMINGGAASTYELTPSKVTVKNIYFGLQPTDLYVKITGEIPTGTIQSNGKNEAIDLPLSAIIQFNRS